MSENQKPTYKQLEDKLKRRDNRILTMKAEHDRKKSQWDKKLEKLKSENEKLKARNDEMIRTFTQLPLL